jgi:hypothetical protein
VKSTLEYFARERTEILNYAYFLCEGTKFNIGKEVKNCAFFAAELVVNSKKCILQFSLRNIFIGKLQN